MERRQAEAELRARCRQQAALARRDPDAARQLLVMFTAGCRTYASFYRERRFLVTRLCVPEELLPDHYGPQPDGPALLNGPELQRCSAGEPSAGVSPANDDGPADADVEHRGRAVPSVGVSRAEAETRAGLEGRSGRPSRSASASSSRAGSPWAAASTATRSPKASPTSPSRRACRVTLIATALTCRQLTPVVVAAVPGRTERNRLAGQAHATEAPLL